jgi:hypothetical protein
MVQRKKEEKGGNTNLLRGLNAKSKALISLLALLILSTIAAADNLTILNSSEHEFYCRATFNNTDGEYDANLYYTYNGTSHTLAYNFLIVEGIFAFNFGIVTLTCNQTLTCHAEYSFEGTTLYNKTITGTYSSCSNTTTTSSSSTSTSTTQPSGGTDYLTLTTVTHPVYQLPNLSDNGTAPISNLSAYGTEILGLGVANFFKVLSAAILLIVMLTIGVFSRKIAILLCVFAMDILLVQFNWFTIPSTLFVLLNVMAVIYFIGGKDA